MFDKLAKAKVLNENKRVNTFTRMFANGCKLYYYIYWNEFEVTDWLTASSVIVILTCELPSTVFGAISTNQYQELLTRQYFFAILTRLIPEAGLAQNS